MIPVSAEDVELLKLGRLLGSQPGELAFLEDVDPQLLRALRHSLIDHLFRRRRTEFERVGALARFLPPVLAAALAEHALGPPLAASIAGVLEADRMAELAQSLSPRFLADLAPLLDPRSLPSFLPNVAPAKLLAAAQALVEREDWVTLAACVDGTPPELLTDAVNSFAGEILLRVGALLESDEAVAQIVALLRDERLSELLRFAATPELTASALRLLSAVDDVSLVRIGRLLAELDEPDQVALAVEVAGDPTLRQSAQRLIDHSPPVVRQTLTRLESEASR